MKGIPAKILSRTIDLMVILAGFLLIFSMVSISAGVLTRYLFGRPMGWVIEISEYSLLYITFLVAAWVLKREGHVKMDLVYNRFNLKTQLLVSMITSVISAIICLILSWYGMRVTWELYQTRYFTPTVLELPKSVITAIVFIGSIVLFFQFLNRALHYLSSWRTSGNQEQRSTSDRTPEE